MAYGAAQLLGRQVKASGIGLFVLGEPLFFIRPHMSLIAILALALAAALSTVAGFRNTEDQGFVARVRSANGRSHPPDRRSGVGPRRTSAVLGDGADGRLGGVLARTRKGRTAEGGSQFAPPAVDSPAKIPMAVVAVLFRPFPGRLAV